MFNFFHRSKVKTEVARMQIIYDENTQALIDQLQEAIETETAWLIKDLNAKKVGQARIRTEVQCNTRLNLMRNELQRIYQIAIPKGYIFN